MSMQRPRTGLHVIYVLFKYVKVTQMFVETWKRDQKNNLNNQQKL